MAVEKVPETLYILRTLKEEANRIKRANAPLDGRELYLTDVQMVMRPSFHHEDIGAILEVKRPCLLLWPVGIQPGTSAPHTFNMRRNNFIVRWVGCVDATSEDNAQDRAIILLDDLYRMMIVNGQRNRPSSPGGTANPYGVGTADSGAMPVSFQFWKNENTFIGMVEAQFAIEFNSPF